MQEGCMWHRPSPIHFETQQAARQLPRPKAPDFQTSWFDECWENLSFKTSMGQKQVTPIRMHVWHIYLHLPSNSTIHAGKYTTRITYTRFSWENSEFDTPSDGCFCSDKRMNLYSFAVQSVPKIDGCWRMWWTNQWVCILDAILIKLTRIETPLC